jgi:hypothetical protein
MIRFKQSGNFNNTERFLSNATRIKAHSILENYARLGVNELAAATPVDTGVTADSWGYEIRTTRKGYTINWTNSNVNNGVPIVILIQYGHGTGNGGYVQGRDFINPAIQPVVDKIVQNLWEEVSRL